jgi:agmatinase
MPKKTPQRLAFMGATAVSSPGGFDAAIFGAPHGTPYRGIDNRVHAGTAPALRVAVKADAEWLEHWDFDLGGPMLAKGFEVADLGDLKTKPTDGPGNRRLIRLQTSDILAAGAVPIMIGGDDSTPIPFIEAFAGHGPLTVLQIDAHIDWRDERYGEPYGFSSTMRRASELSHVERIVQVGMRGMGSAREQEVREATSWGASFVTARDIHHDGVDAVLSLIPMGSRCLVTLDCDALDSSIMPAVAYPSPGGLTFIQVVDLIHGVAEKAKLVGFDLIEFVPKKDRDGLAAFTAARIICNVLGCLARS